MRKVCSKCATVYDNEAVQFCTKCGAPTVPEQQPTVQKVETPKTFCTYCGNEMPATAQFCSKCGKSVKGEPTPIVPVTPADGNVRTARKFNFFLFALIMLIIIALLTGIFAIVALRKRSNELASLENQSITTTIEETTTEDVEEETTAETTEEETTEEETTEEETTEEETTEQATEKEEPAEEPEEEPEEENEDVAKGIPEDIAYSIEDYTHNAMVTDSGRVFVVIKDGVSQDTAESIAEHMNGHLAYITDSESYNAVCTLTSELCGGHDAYVWVGAKLADNHGSYSWFNGASTAFIDNNDLWYPGEPSGVDLDNNYEVVEGVGLEDRLEMWNVNGEWTFNDENQENMVNKCSDKIYFAVEFD